MPVELPNITVSTDGLVTASSEAQDIASQKVQQQLLGTVKLVIETIEFPPVFSGQVWTQP